MEAMMSEQGVIRNILVYSDNEEQSQAYVRLLFYILIYLFYFTRVFLEYSSNPTPLAIVMLVFFQSFGIAHFIWVRRYPAANVIRRSIAVFADISGVTFAMVLLDDAGLFVYPFYLWIIVGNGMRFGRAYLFSALLLTVIEFGSVLYIHPHWVENLRVGLILMGMIIVLPLFFLVLFERLQLANQRMRERLEALEEGKVVSSDSIDPMTKVMFSANSLFRRTFFFIVGIVLSVVALFNYSIIYSQQHALIDVLYSKAKTVAKSIALVTADAMVTEDDSFIVEHLQRVLEDNEEIIYILVSKRGGYSIYSDPKKWSIQQELPDTLQVMQTDEAIGKIMSSEISTEEVYHFSYPVRFSNIKWGWVAIGFSLDQYQKSLREIYRNSVLLLLAMFIVSVLLSYMLAQWLVKPILSLNRAARKVASGDLSVKVDVTSKDEIGELARSFNHMINALKVSDAQLRGSNDLLEQRVKERTEALNQLNLELDERVKTEVQKRTEQEQILIHQSRFAAMGEMIGNIAHQWRQPLNALGLLLQNIENAYEMDMLDEAYITRTVEKGNRLTKTMSQTIDDFRNFFKPNKESEVFSVASSFMMTMDMVRSSLENNMIEITEDVDTSICINGFPSEFSQVLLNLFNNAKDALVSNRKEGRRLSIRLFVKSDKVHIEIEDNAGGVPEAIIEKIFDPYFTTKEEGKGTGIGLYMSKTIIENNMKGRLLVRNHDEGATFLIIVTSVPCKGA